MRILILLISFLTISEFTNNLIYASANHSKNIDVIFVGGGPVGLFNAIKLKLSSPTTNIIVFEKRLNEGYQRNNPLRLFKESLQSNNTLKNNKEYIELIHEIFPSDATYIHLATLTLENILLRKAKEIGIILKNKSIEDPRSILKDRSKYPNLKMLVGTDGRWSKTREKIFKNEMGLNKTLQYIVNVKYKSKGEVIAPKGLSNISFQREIARRKLFNFKMILQDYNKDTNSTAVNLLIPVDQETYNQIQHYTFKNPYLYHGNNPTPLPTKLKKTMSFLIKNQQLFNHEVIQGTGQLAKVDLDVYVSKHFFKLYETKTRGVPVLLAGDSAYGLPYFRALNKAIANSDTFLMASLNILNGKIKEGGQLYEEQTHKRAKREIDYALSHKKKNQSEISKIRFIGGACRFPPLYWSMKYGAKTMPLLNKITGNKSKGIKKLSIWLDYFNHLENFE